MTKHNASNERIKRQYLTYLKEANRQSEQTLDGVAKALSRFEEYNRYKDFKAFHINQAIGFKRHLSEQKGLRSGEQLSKATLHTTFGNLKRFFLWLAGQPGYKSRIQYSDAEYFNLSDKETRIATARREKKSPSLEQVKHVISTMKADTEIERRNRALIAFTLLTGARDGAIASLKLMHIDLVADCVRQDAREVNTKFSKTFDTFFLPVGDEIREILVDWVRYLREEKLWGNDDPLFPSTCTDPGATHQFHAAGLDRKHWRTTSPIRAIFKEAFQNADMPYFNPHSLRKTLVQLGQQLCKTPEELKAWSQNMGHEDVLTTFRSYGEVPIHRQGEIIRNLAKGPAPATPAMDELLDALFQRMREREAGCTS